MMQEEKLEAVLYELEQAEKLEQGESMDNLITSGEGGYFTLLCC